MRSRLTYANVMSSIAVFAALGGSAFAASKITGADVRNNSLTGADVRNRSLTGADLRRGVLPETRWLLLDEAGDIEEQSGGFKVVSKPGLNGQPATNPNVYVDAGESLAGRGLSATIAIQNKLDRDANGMPDPAFAGDVAVARCMTAAVACAPAGTDVPNVFAVRALANNAEAGSQTRRAYVIVTP